MYSELQAHRIIETIRVLENRIAERFPGSGLSRVGAELSRLGADTERITRHLRRPIWPIRVAAAVAVLTLLILAGVVAVALWNTPRETGLSEVLQGTEAAINEMVFLSVAIYFLVSLETRVKRRRALRALHRLRSIVHIVDMHQLTKDPEPLLSPSTATQSSPARTFTRFQLARYLDYCSELLSLSSKLAALHVQYVNDPVVLGAVNDIETLASSLSGKIWQKIMILDTTLVVEPARAPVDAAVRRVSAEG